MRIMAQEEMLKALKTNRARWDYAGDDNNWFVVGALQYGSPNSAKACACLEQLAGFRIFRLIGRHKGYPEHCPDNFVTLYVFEVSLEGYAIRDELTTYAKLSAAMKRQMGEWKEERK